MHIFMHSQPDEDDRTTQRCLNTIRDCGLGLIKAKREATVAEKLDFHSEEKDILSLLSVSPPSRFPSPC
jgi:hypothetical protein